MAGGDRIELLLPRFDSFEGMDAAARGIHLRAQGPVARTGGQAEAAVHAGIRRTCRHGIPYGQTNLLSNRVQVRCLVAE